MKKLIPIMLIFIITLSSTMQVKASAADQNEIIEYGSELWNELADKYIAMVTFGNETFNNVKNKLIDIASREQIVFEKIYEMGPAGLVFKYVVNGSGVGSFVEYLANLNQTDDSGPSGFMKIEDVRWTSGRFTYYLRANVDDVYCIFTNGSGGYGGFYFYSLSSSTTSVRVDAYISGYSGSQGEVNLNTSYQNYKYGYWGGGATPNNTFTPSTYSGYSGAVAFYGYEPVKTEQFYNPVNQISNTGVGTTNWEQVYNTNTENYTNGDTVENIFNNTENTYNYFITNEYSSAPLPEGNYSDMDTSIDGTINNIDSVPDISGSNYDFVTASFNILPGELKGLFMLAMTMIGIKALLGFKNGGITK